MMRAEALDHETKYLLPSAAAPAVRAFLSGVCRPEEPFEASWIDSIYFDTTGLSAYHDKLSSQLHKTKVRLRWYDHCGPVFAEIKRRRGERREKFRIQLDLRGEELERQGLAAPLLAEVPIRLARHGQPVPAELRPVVRVRFRRLRWREPATGARVALDTEIGTVALATRLGGRVAGLLGLGVVELKGAATSLPVRLRPLSGFGCRRSSFSKYAACMTAPITGWIAP